MPTKKIISCFLKVYFPFSSLIFLRLFSKKWLLLNRFFERILFKVEWSGSARLLREQRDRWDPTGVNAEEAHRPPRGKRASGAEFNHTAHLVKSNKVYENSLFQKINTWHFFDMPFFENVLKTRATSSIMLNSQLFFWKILRFQPRHSESLLSYRFKVFIRNMSDLDLSQKRVNI